MKKILIVLLAAFATAYANAAPTFDSTKKEIKEERKSARITLRKLKGSEVSFFSKENFQKDFKNPANVSWSRDDYFDIISFTLDNKNMKAYYDHAGELVGTISPSSFASLPDMAQKYINKHYGDYTVQKVIFFDDNEANFTDMIMYDMQFEDSDSYFVELSNGKSQIVLHVFNSGDVDFLKKLS